MLPTHSHPRVATLLDHRARPELALDLESLLPRLSAGVERALAFVAGALLWGLVVYLAIMATAA